MSNLEVGTTYLATGSQAAFVAAGREMMIF
jgi:hypothetical protein